ncbi:2-polyprenylphenol 6-hydroxylase [Candidatus Puniceispirillum sp.]|nr:2-polyprenylphenol 6-hydroxylase [Candidatus Puniceispirillum sp.]
MIRALSRLPNIAWHLGRAGVLGHMANISMLPSWLRQTCRLLDRAVRSRRAVKDAGDALCQALVRLGPGFIKFGQALSTRSDLIGPELGRSLAMLQDRLPPFAAAHARQIVVNQTGQSIENLFKQFNDEAVAAASIAQVHRATLVDGRAVAVKLLRPNIEKRMQADTALFYSLAQIIEWLAPGIQRLHLVTAVRQFRQLSEMELDLRLEAAAAGRLADNMQNDEGIYIPWVDLENSTRQMLIIEWVDGIRIDDVASLTKASHDVEKITEYAARSFFNQVFRDGYFHADMHPGNIFVRPDGTLVPIDFGIMGYLDFHDRLFLARLLSAMLDRDYDMVASLHKDAGMLGEAVSIHQFSQSVRAVADPVMGKALGDVSLGLVLGQIFQLATRFEIEVQPQFNLLQKTMVMAEGVARQLNPTADMWQLSRPLADDWMQNQANVKTQATQLFNEVTQVLSRLPKIINDFEKSQKEYPLPKPPVWPGRIALMALFLALISFFTRTH